MKQKLYKKLIDELRSQSISKSRTSKFTIPIIKADKILFFSQKGYVILDKLIDLIVSDLKVKINRDNIDLEKLFFDKCFHLLFTDDYNDEEINKSIHNLLRTIEEKNKEHIVIIPISGLKVRRKFNVLDFDIISKNKLKNDFPKDVYKSLDQSGHSFAITHDFGEPKLIMISNREKLDSALNLVRLYIPAFWHHIYEYKISVVDKEYLTTTSAYVISKEEGEKVGRISVDQRPGVFDIHSKRMSSSKYTQWHHIKKMNYNKLNNILKKDTKLSKTLFNSLHWIGMYTREKRNHIKFLFLIFALEGIFTNESNNYSSITAAVSEKVAFLNAKQKDERKGIFDFVKKMYSKRGSIVHGSNIKIKSSELITLYDFLLESFCKLADLIELYDLETTKELNNKLTDKKFE